MMPAHYTGLYAPVVGKKQCKQGSFSHIREKQRRRVSETCNDKTVIKGEEQQWQPRLPTTA
jgi:hypothetical protein